MSPLLEPPDHHRSDSGGSLSARGQKKAARRLTNRREMGPAIRRPRSGPQARKAHGPGRTQKAVWAGAASPARPAQPRGFRETVAPLQALRRSRSRRFAPGRTTRAHPPSGNVVRGNRGPARRHRHLAPGRLKEPSRTHASSGLRARAPGQGHAETPFARAEPARCRQSEGFACPLACEGESSRASPVPPCHPAGPLDSRPGHWTSRRSVPRFRHRPEQRLGTGAGRFDRRRGLPGQ